VIRKKIMIIPVILLGFLLGIHDGHIALWKDGQDEPTVFPYRAQMLPEQDQERLKAGIRIESGTQLHQILEDYLS